MPALRNRDKVADMHHRVAGHAHCSRTKNKKRTPSPALRRPEKQAPKKLLQDGI